MYVTYTSVPSGEMAIAGKSGRSEAGDALPALWKLAPRSTENCTVARSFGPGWASDGVGPSQ